MSSQADSLSPPSCPTRLAVHASAPLLERLTTRYSSTEDRMRVAGALPDGQPVVLWMTQRLLLRLLPRLFQWLETHGVGPSSLVEAATPALYCDAIQSFAQQAALQQLVPQPPVHTPAQTPQALVESVSVGQSPACVHLVLKDAADSLHVGLALGAQPLRQWLAILCRQWLEAQWPMDVWPAWLQETVLQSGHDAAGITH